MWGLTRFVPGVCLPLCAQGLLGRRWSSQDLRVLPSHLKAAERQAAKTLGFTWPTQDSSSTLALLLKGCKSSKQSCAYCSVCLQCISIDKSVFASSRHLGVLTCINNLHVNMFQQSSKSLYLVFVFEAPKSEPPVVCWFLLMLHSLPQTEAQTCSQINQQPH